MLLLAAASASIVWGLRPAWATGALRAAAEDAAAQEIAAAAAAALDRGAIDEVPQAVRKEMARHPIVLAVEIQPGNGMQPIRQGRLDRLGPAAARAAGGERRVTLIRDGRPWGAVRIVFEHAPGSAFGPRNPAFWPLVGLSVVVLPILLAVLERAWRRLDRSSSGPLAVAAERARHTLDTLAEAVLLLDSRGAIIFANATFGRILDKNPATLVGTVADHLPWGEPLEGHEARALPWSGVLTGAGPVRGERLTLRSGETAAAFIVNCTPLMQGRRLKGVLVTLDDVSELEHSRRALQEARDAAQHANEAKSRFLAMMSHEIRTPLNGVCGSLQLLRQTPLDGNQPRYVDAAAFSASTLLHLINDILDFSKIEAGQLELSPIEFDLEQCVDDTMLMLAQNAHAKGLILAYGIDAAVGERFLADPDRIRQVVINLVNNAIKFTHQGAITLRISVGEDGADRQTLRFAIADTGIGIPQAKMDRLFKAFSQVDSSTSRRYGGTGLGLIISKQLCELMGGRIEVSSVEGQGTTFTAVMDLRRAPPDEPRAPDQAGALAELAVCVGLHPFEAEAVSRGIGVTVDRMLVYSSPGDLERRLSADAPLPTSSRVIAVVGGPATCDLVALTRQVRGLLSHATPTVLSASFVPTDHSVGQRDAADGWINRPIGARRLRESLRRASSGEVDAQAYQTRGSGQGTPDLKGCHVLLAEDNPVGQMVVADMLRAAGATCDAVGDGLQVLAALQKDRYDLVLMDCFMPELDGFEATRRIRQLQDRGDLPRQLPIVALTAKAMRGDREACLEAGMDAYVSKPVDQAELLNVAAGQLGPRERQARPFATGPAPSATDVAALREKFSKKPELLERLVDAYRQTAPEDVSRIDDAVRGRDAKALQYAAHRLAGGAGFVCAGAVRELAATLEKHAIEGHIDGCAALAEQLRAETESSIKELERLLESCRTTAAAPPGQAKETTP